MSALLKLAGCSVLVLAFSVGHANDEGRNFFAQQVLPELARNGCMSCHAPARGYVTPAMDYMSLLRYLAIGQSSTNNVLIYKLANQRSFAPNRPTHMGGQRCKSEDVDPCKTIKAWWTVEFATQAPAEAPERK